MQSKEMSNYVDDLSQQIYQMTRTEAIEKGICLNCKQPAISNCYSKAGIKEFGISGLCEICFDKITKEEE